MQGKTYIKGGGHKAQDMRHRTQNSRAARQQSTHLAAPNDAATANVSGPEIEPAAGTVTVTGRGPATSWLLLSCPAAAAFAALSFCVSALQFT